MPTLFDDNNKKSSRFELPALNLNFGSITDGTNIPPPPDSPVQKPSTPPQTPPLIKGNEVTGAVSKEEKAEALPTPNNGNLAGTKRTADDDAPLSPAASSRQGSIRRLFSRTKLNNSYAEGNSASAVNLATANLNRPTSQSGVSLMDDRKSKRRSSWFGRLKSDNSSKRASTMLDVESPRTPTFKKPTGPPPPMIPEMSDLEKDQGSLGSDLFKNIK